MSKSRMQHSVQELKGVGDKRAQLYQKLGVHQIFDLLTLFPRHYIDYTKTTSIADCAIGEVCCLRAKVYRKQGEQRLKKGLSLYRVFVSDGQTDLKITIFNSQYQFDLLELDKEYLFLGKIQGNALTKEMNTPKFVNPQKDSVLQPVYPLTEGLSNAIVQKNVAEVLSLWGDVLVDILPEQLKQQEQLCHLRYAYENIHRPENHYALEVARKRLIFQELLTLQLGLKLIKAQTREQTAVVVRDLALTPFLSSLPFDLTMGQRQAIDDALCDLEKSVPMHRLVQGDVGCGKTMVAGALVYAMANNSYQSALMAPTELLARQHYNTFEALLQPLGIKCALLVGSLSKKQKQAVLDELASGVCSLVVGTHALISEAVQFAKLGLVVTDEQHRFGVEQRMKLAKKGENPHRLVMSATPIPRTLAMILYGDLDVSVIAELPKGRQSIPTYLIQKDKRQRAYRFLLEQIKRGHQAYIVCPLIEEGEATAEQSKGLLSVEQYAKTLEDSILNTVRIGVLHGKMKPALKERTMRQFADHDLDVLLCTTVVEVGVDVPNAVVMMVENSEQFGLSQLHQLRGRVGRGAVQSFCILVSDHTEPKTKQRLSVMTKTNDGFEIAQQDLKQRGPGDFFGNRQHGLPKLKLASLVEDMEVLQRTVVVADKILQSDPLLSSKQNAGLRWLVNHLMEQDFQSH